MPKALTLRQNMAWNSAGSLVFLGCQWLITVLIVRLSSNYDAAGVYSLAMSVYGIFAPIAEYRMYIYQVSDVKNENSIGEYLAFRLITCALSLILCVVYALATCALSAVWAITLYGIYKIASALIDVLHAEDQVKHRMDYIGKSLTLQGIVSIGIFSAVFALFGSLELTLVAMTVGIVLVGLIYDYPRTRQFGSIRFGIGKKKVIHLLVYCAPVVIGFVACATAPSIPRQYLFAVSGEAALGIYASVSAPVAIIQAGASYLYNPLMGYFAESYDKGDAKEFNSFLIKASLGIVVFGVACLVILMFFGGPLLMLMFGESIEAYLYLIPLVAISSIGISFMGFMNGLMLTIRDFKGALVGGVLALIVSLGSTIPFIQLWSMNGVSLVLLASSTISALIMGVFLSKKLHDRVSHDQNDALADTNHGEVAASELSIEEIKKIELELMDELDNVCRENNLSYVLGYGSCLGAVRHHGFIPWDDDIDVLMPRDDYEKLWQIFGSVRSNDRFRLVSYRDKSSSLPFFKLVNTATIMEERYTRPEYTSGVWIDIFPMDATPKDYEKIKKRSLRLQMLRYLACTRTDAGSSSLIILVKKIICPLFHRLGPYRFAKRIDELAMQCDKAKDGTVYDIVAGETWEVPYDEEMLAPKDAPFEDRTYFIPSQSEQYLDLVYGSGKDSESNWRFPPPEDKREVHTLKAYRL